MGGQDGFSRDLLRYTEEANSLMAGIHVKPTDRLGVNAYATWIQSTAALDPFDLPADDYVAITPPTAYDFSIAHTYTDIDLTRVEGGLELKYLFQEYFWARAAWRFIDYQDDAPVLEDLAGRVDFITAALGWSF